MDKCLRCTKQVTQYLRAAYEKRHGKSPSDQKIKDMAVEAAEICVEEGKERGWIKGVIDQ